MAEAERGERCRHCYDRSSDISPCMFCSPITGRELQVRETMVVQSRCVPRSSSELPGRPSEGLAPHDRRASPLPSQWPAVAFSLMCACCGRARESDTGVGAAAPQEVCCGCAAAPLCGSCQWPAGGRMARAKCCRCSGRVSPDGEHPPPGERSPPLEEVLLYEHCRWSIIAPARAMSPRSPRPLEAGPQTAQPSGRGARAAGTCSFCLTVVHRPSWASMLTCEACNAAACTACLVPSAAAEKGPVELVCQRCGHTRRQQSMTAELEELFGDLRDTRS